MRIRDACADDVEWLAVVHVASWKDAYRTLMPDDYLDALQPADRIDWWRTRLAEPVPGSFLLVAEDEDGAIRGFASMLPHEELGPEWALLPQLYLEPTAWGQGIGHALLTEALRRANEAGHRQMELWTVVGNVRARRFYEARGWTTDGTERTSHVWGVDLPEIRYTRPTDPAV
jgi:GNAT superfamily N-acetyltransferase